ncbi:MAG: hypothetical protein LAQ30_01890 [Acidobacteriia bacterium]|nr:hypothetical protein [Terriglobia bacterium]
MNSAIRSAALLFCALRLRAYGFQWHRRAVEQIAQHRIELLLGDPGGQFHYSDPIVSIFESLYPTVFMIDQPEWTKRRVEKRESDRAQPEDKSTEALRRLLEDSIEKKDAYPSRPVEGRLGQYLKLACKQMGGLSTEEAFWIFIPIDRSEEVSWRLAVGQDGGIPSFIRLPVSVAYKPTAEEMKSIVETGQRSEWVVHVHNHPLEPYPGVVTGRLAPSGNDLAFAASWKERLRELARRMRFFVVQGDEFLEY